MKSQESGCCGVSAQRLSEWSPIPPITDQEEDDRFNQAFHPIMYDKAVIGSANIEVTSWFGSGLPPGMKSQESGCCGASAQRLSRWSTIPPTSDLQSTGSCGAQCSHDMKFINGVANVDGLKSTANFPEIWQLLR